MSEAIQFVGLDVHAAQTAAAAVELGSGVVGRHRIIGPPLAAVAWLAGFGLARAARELGVEMAEQPALR